MVWVCLPQSLEPLLVRQYCYLLLLHWIFRLNSAPFQLRRLRKGNLTARQAKCTGSGLDFQVIRFAYVYHWMAFVYLEICITSVKTTLSVVKLCCICNDAMHTTNRWAVLCNNNLGSLLNLWSTPDFVAHHGCNTQVHMCTNAQLRTCTFAHHKPVAVESKQ